MTEWPSEPLVYEIDTWPWLQDLSQRYRRSVTLGDVPPDAWEDTVPEGTDAVWLMGVWERSPAGLAIALQDPDLLQSFGAALPDLRNGDVVGSPYCVRRYVVDERLGGLAGLAAARSALARRGRRLVLDYVPNHVAPDHPWVLERPEVFVQGTPDDLADESGSWLELDGRLLARGRDPNFPPWPDVVQLNAFAPETRGATVDALASIGEQCDGVRCDMAMLMTNDVFAKTWGDRVGPAPLHEFWPDVISAVRARHHDMLFVAEAYWDMEWILQQQGFDFCYDKRLYDRLVHEDAESVRLHLTASLDYQRRLVRFLENHDEPRASSTMPLDRQRAAAVAVATLPGATLWHDGQLDGRRVHLPVFLSRRPDEPIDTGLRDFYGRLISGVATGGLRKGEWRMLSCSGWPDNTTYGHLLAWAWSDGLPHHVVVVNFSPQTSQGHVELPWNRLRGGRWRLTDVLDRRIFDRDGDELADAGLYVELSPWAYHVLEVKGV